jgi:hypothetical protein
VGRPPRGLHCLRRLDLCILGCIVFDTVKNRRLHPAFGWGFLFVVGSQAFRLWLSGTPQWMSFAKWLVG